MARKPRIHFPGATYHVTLRGNGGQDIFFDEDDGREFRALIADGLDRMGHKLYAYTLLPNTIHLLIEVGDVPLSKIMQNLSFRYTRYINIKMDREGHLFGGRFKALLIDPDKYLLSAMRAIHMAPVRADLAASASDWLWGSDRAYRRRESDNFINSAKLLQMLSTKTADQTAAYERFMKEAGQEVWPPEGICGDIIGDASFISKATGFVAHAKVEHVALSAKQLFDLAEKHLDVTRAELKGLSKARAITHKRAIFARAVHETCGYSMAEIAKGLKRDGSSLGRLVQKLRDEEPAVQALKNAILRA